jgi:catechol 2,3-dioxygenase-like lactoylglutathione lyase family enzyme
MADYRPSHFGLCVSDLERSLRFYCDGLGFERVHDFELDSDTAPGLDRALEVPGRTRLVSQFIKNDTMSIELLHYLEPGVEGEPAKARNQRGLTHLSFDVDDVDTAALHLVACGGTVLDDTRASVGVEILFLADPDGVRVELMAPPIGSDSGSEAPA